MWPDNPFMNLGMGYGTDPTTGWGFGQMPASPAGWEQVPLPEFSMEGGVGGNVSPITGYPERTLEQGTDVSSVGADTDKGVAAQKKGADLQSVLRGLKAPEAPRPQTIRSPEAPRVTPPKSSLSTLLASMGVSPQQMLRLGQTMGR